MAVHQEGVLEVGAYHVICTVLSVSAGGAKIHVNQTLGEREAVTLCVGRKFRCSGKVAWQMRDQAGIAFTDDPDIVARRTPALVDKPASLEGRAHIRFSVLWNAELVAGSQTTPCEILNISLGGARMRSRNDLPAGAEVQIICIRFVRVGARVMWVNQGEVGVKFSSRDKALARTLSDLHRPYRPRAA